MLFQNQLMLYISKNSISVHKILIGKNPTSTLVTEFSWTPELLPGIINTIRRKVGSKTRIVLSEDLAYVASFSLPASTPNLVEAIKEKAQEQIPDSLDETIWDYKIGSSASKTSQTIPVQVAALTQAFYTSFSPAFIKAKLAIEVMEPISLALARLTAAEPNLHIIAYGSTDSLLMATQHEYVFVTQRVSQITKESLLRFIEIMKTQYAITPLKIIASGIVKSGSELHIEQVPLENKLLNPLIGLAFRKDTNTKETNVLNLAIAKGTHVKTQSEPGNTISENTQSVNTVPPEVNQSSHRRTILVMVLCLALLGIIGAGVFSYLMGPKEKTPVQPTATPPLYTPSPIPKTASPTLPPLSKFSVVVLNGSTREGVASKLAALLTENGYQVIQTDNADTSDYQSTEIHVKDNVPESVKIALDKLVKTSYASSIYGPVVNQKPDIIIIIGQK